MIDREKQLRTITRFRKCVTLTVSSFFAILGIGTVIKSSLPGVFMSSIYQVAFGGMLAYLSVLYICLLALMYRTARILYLAQLLKAKAWLLLVLAIVATPIAFFVNVIIVIVLWRKGKKLLSSPAKML